MEQSMTTADTMLIGLIPTVVIVCLHVIGLQLVSRRLHMRTPRRLHLADAGAGVLVTFQLLVLLISLHGLNMVLWALFTLGIGAFDDFETAMFFNLENYTALGLTRVQIPELWRSIPVYISLTGVFCLAWSTSVLVNVNRHLVTAAEAR
jgi:hypothetical protein